MHAKYRPRVFPAYAGVSRHHRLTDPQRGRWTAAGSVIIDWQNRSLVPIDGNLDAVIDHWAWTHDPQAHTSTMIDLGTGTTTTSPVTATPARPLGLAQNHLIVISDDDQGHLNLYGLKSA